MFVHLFLIYGRNSMKIFKKLFLTILISTVLLVVIIPNPSISAKSSNSLSFILLSQYKNSVNIGDEFFIVAITSNGKLPKWKSSDSKIASVNTYGKVTAKKSGSVTITAKISNAEATCKVTVNKTKITLDKTSIELERGNNISLYATTSIQSQVTWKSSKKSIATIDENGTITALKPGETIITATAGGSTATSKVTVKYPSIKLNETKVKLYRNQTYQLKATVSSGIKPIWKSSKKSVAIIDEYGVITAIKNGSTTITATLDGVSKTCEVIVEKPTITLNETELSLVKGSSQTLVANVSSGNKPIYSTSNPNIVTIDNNGIMKAISKGKAYVYASEDGVKIRCTVHVTE